MQKAATPVGGQIYLWRGKARQGCTITYTMRGCDKRGFGVVEFGQRKKRQRQEEFHAKSCQSKVSRHAGVADKIKVKMRMVAEAHAPKSELCSTGIATFPSPSRLGSSLVASPRLFRSQPLLVLISLLSSPPTAFVSLPPHLICCVWAMQHFPALSWRLRLLDSKQWMQLAMTRHDCSPTNQ